MVIYYVVKDYINNPMHDDDKIHIVGNAALTSSLTTAGVTGIVLTYAARSALTAARWAARTATYNRN